MDPTPEQRPSVVARATATAPSDACTRAVFEGVSDAILIADDAGHYVAANPAAETLTSFSREDLCSMSVFDLTPPPTEEQGRELWATFLRTGSMAGDYKLARQDGAVEVEFRAVGRQGHGTRGPTFSPGSWDHLIARVMGPGRG